MSLTNPNTPVSQQDLQDFYHKLLPYMGGSFGLVATGIDSANLYSTTERVVGQWIDGKPLYQKTLTGTAPASSATQNIQIGANVESALVISGYCQHESFLTPVNIQIDTNEYFMAWIRDNSNPNVPNTVGIKVGSILYNEPYKIVLQYTKTTDSAVESYGTDTTYSTDEHVVGSWIDGSPVYQKVIKLSNLIAFSVKESWTNIADISSLNASKLIYCYALCDVDDSIRHAPVFYRANNGYLQYFQKNEGIFTEYESDTFIIQYTKTS